MYQAMGFPPEMFTVLFAIPRTAGWLAQWQELVTDPEQKITRPRQISTGYEERSSCRWRENCGWRLRELDVSRPHSF